jgi:hypothetical protein
MDAMQDKCKVLLAFAVRIPNPCLVYSSTAFVVELYAPQKRQRHRVLETGLAALKLLLFDSKT